MLDREDVLRRNWTKFVLDWRHLQGYHWSHLRSNECDCIIIINITNKNKTHLFASIKDNRHLETMTNISKTEFCGLVPAGGAWWRSQPNACSEDFFIKIQLMHSL